MILYHKCSLNYFTGLNVLNKEQVSLLFIINDMLCWLHVLARQPLVSFCNKSINSQKEEILIACDERKQNAKLDFVIPNRESVKVCCLFQSFLTPSPLLSLLVTKTHVCFTKEWAFLMQVWRKIPSKAPEAQTHSRCSYTVSPLMVM